jgi:hypothetical protein
MLNLRGHGYDLCSIFVDMDINSERRAAAFALALDAVGRPVDPYDHLPRDPLLSLRKLQ